MRVRLSSEWTKYAGRLAGLEMLGVVFHENGDAGALARTRSGVYVQVNGARIQDLDQTLVRVEIALTQRISHKTNVVPFSKRRL